MKQENYIKNEAPRMAERWTNQQKAAFHAHNPNGLGARKRANDAAIEELFAAGRISSTAREVYGKPRDSSLERLEYIATCSRGFGTPETWAAIWGLERDVEEAEKAIEGAS